MMCVESSKRGCWLKGIRNMPKVCVYVLEYMKDVYTSTTSIACEYIMKDVLTSTTSIACEYTMKDVLTSTTSIACEYIMKDALTCTTSIAVSTS